MNSISSNTHGKISQDELDSWEDYLLGELNIAHSKALEENSPVMAILHSCQGENFEHVMEEDEEYQLEIDVVEVEGEKYENCEYYFPEPCPCGTVRLMIRPDSTLSMLNLLEEYKKILKRKN